ncbi:hypothetical protein [cf. Phormidesmis sp. LEGE 11477]|uniref:hypothetical protein n=1 Tax=cf. Phormidesmis sp. LEGE 11477 TaxID=1828680 RepID=UPI00188263CA|nr:hypothetical protein [cf. Phormidesmis sp. LEGE 11477]MBE9063441.1 hypothetical protein [cf. Phormidesmis sp. LEGE 11477]
MDTYHQLTLFNLDSYSSESSRSGEDSNSGAEKFSKEVNFKQLELDFSPKLPQLKYRFFERLSRAA